MESSRSVTRHPSLRIPSFNDLNTLTHDELDFDTVNRPARVKPQAKQLDRTWSVESAETPTRSSSSFAETFSRALYEHMRGN